MMRNTAICRAISNNKLLFEIFFYISHNLDNMIFIRNRIYRINFRSCFFHKKTDAKKHI